MIFTGLQCSWNLLCSVVRYPWYVITYSAIYCAYWVFIFHWLMKITIIALVTCINIFLLAFVYEAFNVFFYLLSCLLISYSPLFFFFFVSAFRCWGSGIYYMPCRNWSCFCGRKEDCWGEQCFIFIHVELFISFHINESKEIIHLHELPVFLGLWREDFWLSIVSVNFW